MKKSKKIHYLNFNSIKHKKTKKKYRYEEDVFGKVPVPSNHYWGSNTQRSLIHFSIGKEHMPINFIYSYAILKKCAAIANYKLHSLTKKHADTIVKVCNEILEGKLDNEFPLYIWQTGSGTQTNMNLNEVISNRCNEILVGKLGSKSPIHPNNHVNMSQSSNDTFISAIHISIALSVIKNLIPNLNYMIKGFKQKKLEFNNIIKIGRTHLEDALPLTFGEEFSGYIALLDDVLNQINFSLKNIFKLATGGTAVGNGINANKNFGKVIAKEISKETKLPFVSAENKFAEMSSHNAVLEMSNTLKVMATNIMKIANDIRWMGSGPKTGINELLLPQNEPGSSIMAGKVNPTQCEAATMVAVQVMANNMAITIANSQGNFEMNVYNPLMIYNINQSIYLLSDVCVNFTKFCVIGLKVNNKKVKYYLDNSLTKATLLNPYIGYDKASKLTHYAYNNNITLKEANKKLNYLSDNDFDKYINNYKII
jgi:fumarate hydratase class II